ncbi:MAG TPA: GH92 family glycosyl hydrolase [Bacillales bacterium]|nr:GH92 family glycosyl hydrolase [Bacillales bacterium]
MKKRNRLLSLSALAVLMFGLMIAPILMPAAAYAKKNTSMDKLPVSYVDPLIGTGVYSADGAMGEANVFPGATMPHGMVQFSPDTGRHIAGYMYGDSQIQGFSLTHLSGTGCWGLGNFLTTATTGQLATTEGGYASSFSHDQEKASAGYYSVMLQDYDIRAEITATTRAGFARYTFPKSKKARILFDASHTLEDTPVSDASVKVVDDQTIVGSQTNPSPFCGGTKPYKVYFAAKFSKPFQTYGTWDGNQVSKGSDSASGDDIGAFVNYDTQKGEQVLVKIGISFVSTDQAMLNLKKEIPDWDFEKVKHQASKTWNDELKKIEVYGGSHKDKVKFYTSLYHALLGPYTFSDVNGKYIGMDDKIHTAKGYVHYHTFSLWDTYRAAHPLYALIEPKRQVGFVKTLLDNYENGGWLPKWPMVNAYTNCMISDHASSVIAATIMKGITGFDVQEAYKAMRHNAMKTPTDSHFEGRVGLADYKKLGYVPSEDDSQSVSMTLEDAYVDWALAQVAKKLGKTDDYKLFMNRADNYINVFDPQTRWMRPRSADGSWEKNFDPRNWGGFTEGNSWTYSWYVPQDVQGLVQLMGKQTFTDRLDHFFETFAYPGWGEKITHYWHGNEPDQQAPYLYNFVGEPWKTQDVVRRIMDQLYGTGPSGIPGNEDVGQLSSWYVLSAMGFYPVAPARGIYQLGSPQFDKVVIHLPEYHYGGKDFVIKTTGTDKDKRYIESANLNGAPLKRAWFTQDELTKGGVLKLVMGDSPNKDWGTRNLPPSMTTEEPDLSYSGFALSTDNVDANEPLKITTTVKNEGGIGTVEAMVNVDGKPYDSKSVVLNAGESKEITITTRLYKGGEHTISVGNLDPETVTVNPKPAQLTYSDLAVKNGDSANQITAEAEVKNIGSYDTTKEVDLYVNNEVVDSKQVTVGPGEAETVSFSYTFQTDGFHWVRIGDTQPQVVVPEGYSPTPQPVPSSVLTTSDGANHGLTANYYNNMNMDGSPALTRVDKQIYFNWGGGSPGSGVNSDRFSARWTGNLTVPVSGTYEFFLRSDDASRLYIDGNLVIDNWGDHSPRTRSGFVRLKAGDSHSIKIEYYENGGGAVAKLSWVTPLSTSMSDESVTIQPGGSNTFTIKAKNYNAQTVDIDWSADVPSGLSLSPNSGSFAVEAGGTNTLKITAQASDNAQEDVYTVPIQLKVGSTKLSEMSVQIVVASPGNLVPFFNNTGISDDSDPGKANFDLVGWSYSYQAMKSAGLTPGGAVSHDGLTFTWPKAAPGEQDNIIANGQTILFDASGSKLGFLGSATNGPSEGTGTIKYTDGTEQEFQLGFSDWTLGGGSTSDPSFGNDIIASMPYRNSQSGQQSVGTYVFYTSVPLKDGKTVKSVTLPDSADQGNLHVFAMDIE